MIQVLVEKFADVLVPVVMGLLAWFGFHYFVLTPRIMYADLKVDYANYHIKHDLPASVGKCIRNNITSALLTNDKLEAAIFTSSLKHLSSGFSQALVRAETVLDDKCGAAEARRANALANELTRKEALAKKRRELDRLAEAQAIEQAKKQIQLLFGLFTEGR